VQVNKRHDFLTFDPDPQFHNIMEIRKALSMSVNAGAEEKCEKRRNPIWPELEKALKGVRAPKCPAKFALISLPANFRKTEVHKAA
jgi:hypothetical protein